MVLIIYMFVSLFYSRLVYPNITFLIKVVGENLYAAYIICLLFHDLH